MENVVINPLSTSCNSGKGYMISALFLVILSLGSTCGDHWWIRVNITTWRGVWCDHWWILITTTSLGVGGGAVITCKYSTTVQPVCFLFGGGYNQDQRSVPGLCNILMLTGRESGDDLCLSGLCKLAHSYKRLQTLPSWTNNVLMHNVWRMYEAPRMETAQMGNGIQRIALFFF